MYAVWAEESLTQASVQALSQLSQLASPLCTWTGLDMEFFVCVCTSEENGVANEAIVVDWLVSTASWDFQVVKKCCAGTALIRLSIVVCAIPSTPMIRTSVSTSVNPLVQITMNIFCHSSHLYHCSFSLSRSWGEFEQVPYIVTCSTAAEYCLYHTLSFCTFITFYVDVAYIWKPSTSIVYAAHWKSWTDRWPKRLQWWRVIQLYRKAGLHNIPCLYSFSI